MNESARDGFALPLVMFAIALISMALVMTFPSIFHLAKGVKQAQAQLDLQRAAIVAESRVSFFLLTEPMGSRGLEVGGVRLAADGSVLPGGLPQDRRSIVFDGRQYQMTLSNGRRILVRLQDEDGLINLNVANGRLVANMLQVCGFSQGRAEYFASRLIRERAPWPGGAGQDLAEVSARSRQWLTIFSGDRGQAVISATSVVAPAREINTLTAPEGVVRAIFNGKSKEAKEFIRLRELGNNVVKMTVKSNGNDYNYPLLSYNSEKYRRTIRLNVQFDATKLTAHLPDYFYETAIQVNVKDPIGSFTPKGAVFNAGIGAQCGQSSGEAIVPLPAIGAANF